MASRSNVLIIGVGGTGTKIIRNMLDGWMNTGGKPRHIAAVIIDAHDGTPEGGQRSDWFFSGSTRIHYPNAHNQHLGNPKSRLERWWPDRVHPSMGVGFHEGCGALRANGRFYSLHYADRIKSAVIAAMDSLSHARNLEDRAPDSAVNWEAYVCMSLGNGTGAGNLIPVAAIVRHLLLDRGAVTPRVTAVVVPASVTKVGNRGMLAHHVAAAGIAALVELQYECSRKTAGHRPTTPYEHVGFVDGNYEIFRPWRGNASSEVALTTGPYDQILLLDQFNTSGIRHDYAGILTAAAEALRALLGGADPEHRLMDYGTRTEGKPFGSLGVMAYATPTRELASWCAAQQALLTLDEAQRAEFDVKLASDLELLDDRVGLHQLGRPTLQKAKDSAEAVALSVDFFVDHVLEIREKGADDLFNRFEAAVAQLKTKFDIAAQAAVACTALKERADKLSALLGVLEQTDKECAKFESMMDSDFTRPPVGNPQSYGEDHEAAGTRWLLEAKALLFVDKGLFGLGATWLHALGESVERQRANVMENEIKQHLGGNLHKAPDDRTLPDALKAIVTETDSFWRFLRRGALDALGEDFVGQARVALQFKSWQAKANAVDAMLKRVGAHVAVLENACSTAASALGTPGVRKALVDQQEEAEEAMRGATNGSKAGDKLKYLRIEQDVREALVAEIGAASGAASSAAVLAELGGAGLDLLAAALSEADYGAVKLLDARRNKREWPGSGKQEAAGVALAKHINEKLQEPVRSKVLAKGGIEKLLLEQGRIALEGYKTNVVDRGGRALDRKAEEWKTKLEEAMPPAIFTAIESAMKDESTGYDWESTLIREVPGGGGKQEGVLMLYLQGRLTGFIGAAQPLWRPRRPESTQLLGLSLFTFSAGSALIEQALQAIKQTEAGKDIRIQAVEHYPPERIDCVCVELGGELDWVVNDADMETYRKAMMGLPGAPPNEQEYAIFETFNPHSELQYQAVGQRWLETRAAADRPRVAGASAAVLVALARMNVPGRNLLGYLEQKAQNFYAAKDFAQSYPGGQPSLPNSAVCSAGTHLGPSGVVDFVDWLDGNARKDLSADAGRDLAIALKSLIWADLSVWLHGDTDTNVAPVPVEAVAAVLNAEAGTLNAKRGKDAATEQNKVMAAALMELANDLMRSRGARPASLT